MRVEDALSAVTNRKRIAGRAVAGASVFAGRAVLGYEFFRLFFLSLTVSPHFFARKEENPRAFPRGPRFRIPVEAEMSQWVNNFSARCHWTFFFYLNLYILVSQPKLFPDRR